MANACGCLTDTAFFIVEYCPQVWPRWDFSTRLPEKSPRQDACHPEIANESQRSVRHSLCPVKTMGVAAMTCPHCGQPDVLPLDAGDLVAWFCCPTCGVEWMTRLRNGHPDVPLLVEFADNESAQRFGYMTRC
jgi:transcription elongation factor Elf1